MATQTDVQQLIQGLAPSGVNNGNPNTAYNSPMPPVMDAFGNWSAPQVSRAANVTVNRGVPQALPQAAPPTRLGFLPPLPPLNLNPNWATPRPSTPLPPTPVVNPPVPPTAAPAAPPVPPLPPVPGSGVGAGTGQGGWMGGDIRDIQDTATFNGIGATNGMNLINSGAFGGSTGGTTGLPGNFSWQDALDLILPGNAYLSGTDQWDFSNLAGGIGDLLAGLPGGVSYNDAVNQLGKLGIDQGWDPNNVFIQQYMDNALNNVANNFNQMGEEINQGAVDNTSQLVQEVIDRFGGTSGTGGGGATNVLGQVRDPGNPTNTFVSPTSQAAINSGATVIMNDAWGDAARGFGVGATSSGSAGNYALADAMRQNRLNRV